MNNQQLTNTDPPVIDFLALDEHLQSPNHAGVTSQRLAVFVEEARQRLVGLPYAERLKEVQSFIWELRRMKPADLDVWWERMKGKKQCDGLSWPGPCCYSTHYPIDHVAPTSLPFTGFTGIATIKSVKLEGYDVPYCEQVDGFTHHERRAMKDNQPIGVNEEAEVTPDE